MRSLPPCAAARCGLKPAHGSLSGRGIVPIASLLDSAGPLTRTFADAVQVYSAMRGEPLAPLRALEAGRLPERLGLRSLFALCDLYGVELSEVFRRLDEGKNGLDKREGAG